MVFPADEWPEGSSGAAGTGVRAEAPTAVLGPPGGGRLTPAQLGVEAVEPAWDGERWQHAYQRVRLTGRAYVWLNLVEQRLRALLDDLLRPVYEPAHGADWVTAAAGPAGEEWVRRAAAVREVSRRKGYLLDPVDDDPLVFLTLPQLRELMVQHWPCFEPYLDDRREIELTLDELEVARHVVSRNRSLTATVLAQTERAAARVLGLLDGRPAAGAGLPSDVIEELVAGRYADVAAVHADRILLQRDLPVEDLLEGARRLDALGIALGMLCQNFTGKRLARLAADGCRIRLLFLNPASSAVRRRERELGLGRGSCPARSRPTSCTCDGSGPGCATRVPSRSGSSTRLLGSPPIWWRAPARPGRGGAAATSAWSSPTCAGPAGSSRRPWCCARPGPAARRASPGCWRSTGRSSKGSGPTHARSAEADSDPCGPRVASQRIRPWHRRSHPLWLRYA